MIHSDFGQRPAKTSDIISPLCRPGLERQIARCIREIAALKQEARAGNPDVLGIMMALADWRTEHRLLIGYLFDS